MGRRHIEKSSDQSSPDQKKFIAHPKEQLTQILDKIRVSLQLTL